MLRLPGNSLRDAFGKNRNLTVQARAYAKVTKSTQALMLSEGKTLFSICVCCADMCKIFNTVCICRKERFFWEKF